MRFKVTSSGQLKPQKWAGGTTTQLYIYPESANYKQLNFDFRISTATVEVEKSEFTSLKGVSRKLMVLNGETTLCHESHYTKLLKKFDVDKFEGDWQTSSIGKCTDFNLMTIGKNNGEISALIVKEEQNLSYEINENVGWLFIYVYSGKVCISLNNKPTILSKGDLLVINELNNRNIDIKGMENGELVFSEIKIIS